MPGRKQKVGKLAKSESENSNEKLNLNKISMKKLEILIRSKKQKKKGLRRGEIVLDS